MEKKVNIFERLLYLVIICGICFFCGVFYTFYKIDQRTWNEDILKARDIETRLLNYPKQRCYKQDDLKRIVYGNKGL
tara:strand:- start:222 stop:452 length:231 start_codon:yes stop_codon:yes gene_type:complete